ncbi:Phospho-2-dehydro-3-deoxyheptonate aldolase, Phe-sensitive [compost metagenome]
MAQQICSGSRAIFGVMVESNLVAGAQKFTPGQHSPSALTYGQSITDACIGWDDSVAMLDLLGEAVNERRGHKRNS